MSIAPDTKPQASILVVDDDRRVVELLSIALGAYGYRVLHASDGDEALRVAVRERPDLVVLDVRLPRKSGYEVCERLRQDPDDPHVPIIMVSAAAETEARLQGLARGADDYVSKPFSPKELIARIRNLLARAAESRDARRRGLLAERELQGAREEAKRSQAELKEEQRLRDMARTFGWSLEGTLDVEHLAARVLLECHAHLGVSLAAVLRADDAGRPLTLAATRGELLERRPGLEVRNDGELAALLRGLGRPVRLRELERFHELRPETEPFLAAGFTALVPLRGPDGLEGVLATGERDDVRDLTRRDLDLLGVLGETAGLALHRAEQGRRQAEAILQALEPMARSHRPAAARVAHDEAAAWCSEAAASVLSPPARALLRAALPLVAWARTAEGRHALENAAAHDATGWCDAVVRIVASACEDGPFDDQPLEIRRAVALLVAMLGFYDARSRGLDAEHAASDARRRVAGALDPATREALAD